MTKTPLTRDLLILLYVEENLTAEQIAERTGYSRSRVFYYLDKEGIPRNKRVVEIEKNAVVYPEPVPDRPFTFEKGHHRIPDKAWLHQRYWGDNRTVTDIAKELGVNPNSVTKALHRHGIPIKPKVLSYRDKPRKVGDWSMSMHHIIMKRDEYKCRLCGSTDDLIVHHIIPQRLGGGNEKGNGIVLCRTCHREVGNQEVNWIGQLLEQRGGQSINWLEKPNYPENWIGKLLKLRGTGKG